MYLDKHALRGRTILLTGASRGIGAVTARTLAATDATVIAQFRTESAGAADAVSALPPQQKLLLEADFHSPEAARDLWRQALDWRQQIHVLVLNAAAIPESPIDGTDEQWDAGWQEAMAVNVVSAGALMREAVRYFDANGGGTVVVLSSWAGQQGSRIRDLTAYAASKAAIRNLAQTFARHYAHRGVRVYVIAPGVVDAGMSVIGRTEAERATVAAGLTMGRATDAREIAELIAFLCTDACPTLTGATFDMNGASYIR